MHISKVRLKQFRRFTDLEISGLTPDVRLVVLAGPNGCGKSSLFDAFNVKYQMHSGFGGGGDQTYYAKSRDNSMSLPEKIEIEVFDGEPYTKGAFYFRSAYRNDPEFLTGSLSRMGPVVDDLRVRRMIESDAAVGVNYQRLASQALEDVFANEKEETTIGRFRDTVIGDLKSSISRMFPNLTLNGLGNPLSEGTFRFDKGAAKEFEYKNLSGGEKAAFDLILDIVVKRKAYADSVYCIDEPEAHMNTRLQGQLLGEMLDLLPEKSQLWVATHSIGMMHKAREVFRENPKSVAFLDFGDHDFDKPVVITPSQPTRALWERVLSVALDDLAALVVPRKVIVCEGNPIGAVPGKNAEHDATILNNVFGDDVEDVKFIAGGNATEVARDRLGFVAALPMVAKGIAVARLIDRDDHAPADVARMASEGITVLGRRHLEAYIYDDEVLRALCASLGQAEKAPDLVAAKHAALVSSAARGNPPDDIKSAAGQIYVDAKRILGLTAVGNSQTAFARNMLAPLIRPRTSIYAELRRDIFGA